MSPGIEEKTGKEMCDMRKTVKTRFVVPLMLAALLLSSCSLQSFVDQQLEKLLETAESTEEAHDPAGETEPPDASPRYVVSVVENEQFEDDIKRRAAAHIDPFILQAVEQMNTFTMPTYAIKDYVPPIPARDSLRDPVSVEIYDTILRQVSNFEDYSFDDRNYSHDNFFGAFASASDALKVDHRELFLYCDMLSEWHIYRSGYYMPGMWLNDLCEDREAIKQEVLFFRAVGDRILEKMPSGLNRSEQCAYFIFVIALTASYDDDLASAANHFQEYDTLVKKSAICQGYARTFAYLCQRAGIACHYCTGNSSSGGAHAWNCIDTEDGPIYIDITWYDSATSQKKANRYLFMTPQTFDEIGYIQKTVE